METIINIENSEFCIFRKSEPDRKIFLPIVDDDNVLLIETLENCDFDIIKRVVNYRVADSAVVIYLLNVWRDSEVNAQSIEGKELRKKGFHLDHIVPVVYGFNHHIESRLIGGMDNLRIIKQDENMKKGSKITKESLSVLQKWFAEGLISESQLAKKATLYTYTTKERRKKHFSARFPDKKTGIKSMFVVLDMSTMKYFYFKLLSDLIKYFKFTESTVRNKWSAAKKENPDELKVFIVIGNYRINKVKVQ